MEGVDSAKEYSLGSNDAEKTEASNPHVRWYNDSMFVAVANHLLNVSGAGLLRWSGPWSAARGMMAAPAAS
jgi:hypothetical protein